MIFDFLFSYIFGFVLLFAYILYIIWKSKKIPVSISATIYSLEDDNKWLYSLITIMVALLIAPHLFEITSAIGKELIAFFTIFGMLGTGADPLVYGEKNIVHYSCAAVVGVSSQVISYLLCPYTMFLWIPYVIYTLYMDDGRWNMLFGEMVMMLALMICGIVKA
jgi:hypothetical protein